MGLRATEIQFSIAYVCKFPFVLKNGSKMLSTTDTYCYYVFMDKKNLGCFLVSTSVNAQCRQCRWSLGDLKYSKGCLIRTL